MDHECKHYFTIPTTRCTPRRRPETGTPSHVTDRALLRLRRRLGPADGGAPSHPWKIVLGSRGIELRETRSRGHGSTTNLFRIEPTLRPESGLDIGSVFLGHNTPTLTVRTPTRESCTDLQKDKDVVRGSPSGVKVRGVRTCPGVGFGRRQGWWTRTTKESLNSPSTHPLGSRPDWSRHPPAMRNRPEVGVIKEHQNLEQNL